MSCLKRILARRQVFFTVVLIAATVAMSALGPSGFHAITRNQDFVAYYCAGVVANGNRDIYLMEPLRTCENRVSSNRRHLRLYAMPAPLPAYNVGMFRLLAELPFAAASWLWFVLMCVVGAMAILVTIRLSRLAPIVVISGMSFSVLVSAAIGQQVAISILGILLLAWAFERGAPKRAFFGALLAATEPHLGAFAIFAVLLWGAPRLRVAIVAAGFVLLTASIIMQPPRLSAEYIRFVLPIHALSEINYDRQYSLAYALHRLGVNEAASVHASECVFAALLAIALACVPRIRHSASAAIAIVAPTALLLVTGPFAHITQLAIAEPAALLLWTRTRQPAFAWAALLLAMPWIMFPQIFMLAPLIAGAFAVLSFRLVNLRPTYGIVLGALIVFACTFLGVALDSSSHVLASTSARATSFAEVSWRDEVDLVGASHPLTAVLLKLPTFVGLALVGWSFARTAFRGAKAEDERRPASTIGSAVAKIAIRPVVRSS